MAAPETPVRADAVVNMHAILAAADEVFREQGADAPLDEVRKRAGVGRATMYRRFPTRTHLWAALLRTKVNELTTAAETRADLPDAWQAIQEWIVLCEEIGAEYRGLAAQVAMAMLGDESPVEELCGPMRAAFDRLWRRAQQDSGLRREVTSADFLAIVASLPRVPATGRVRAHHLAVVLDGVKARPGPPVSSPRRTTGRNKSGKSKGQL